jgi:hypothetical protein
MEWKLLLLILSIFVIFVVFYRTLKQGCNKKEGYEDQGDSKEVETAVQRKIICSKNKYDSTTSLPLREYLIQGCFNTAYNGKNVSTATIQQRLTEGYRFLDFNVFCASGEIVYVGYSKTNAPTTSATDLSFGAALEYIANNAFKASPAAAASSGPSLAANYINFPVWVHIRVYRPSDSNTDVIGKVAELIRNAQVDGSRFYRNSDGKPTQINGCTPLDSIGPKILFSVDIENVRQVYHPLDALSAEWTPVATRESIRSFANVLTGGSTIPAFYRYTDSALVEKTMKLGTTNGEKLKMNIKYMYVVYPHPDDSQENPEPAKLVLDRSIQLIPMRVYLKDNNLQKYIDIFKELKTPFAPMSYVYAHLNK